MGVFLKLVGWLVFGAVAAALVGTLASVLAVSGHSQIDLPATSNAFLIGAGLTALISLAVSLLAWRPRVAVARLSMLIAAASVAYPIANFAAPLLSGHPLINDAPLASAAAVAPAAAGPLINAIIGSGMFGVIGFAATALSLLIAVILLRSAGDPDAL